MGFGVFNVGLHQTVNVQTRADLNLLCAYLTVLCFALIGNLVQFHLVVHGRSGWVVSEYVQRSFTRMESGVAKVSVRLFVGLAFLELEVSAGHVFVEAFVIGCHGLHPF